MINIKLLRIAYNQYFCNIHVLSDDELLNIHFIFLEKIDKDEDISEWEDIHKDLLIWLPFENAMPSQILKNIQSLILDVENNLLPDSNVYVNINIIELASELAHEKTKEWFDSLDIICEKQSSNGDIYYTESAQDYFNDALEYYYDFIENINGSK